MKQLSKIFVHIIAPCVMVCLGSPARLRADTPNVVLIVVEDLGGSDLGCYGSKFHQTPQLDRLAARGVRFTQAYSAASGGMGAFGAPLSGMSPARLQMAGWISPDRNLERYRLLPPMVSQRLPSTTQSLAEILQKQGKLTALIEDATATVPKIRGFDMRKDVSPSSATD